MKCSLRAVLPLFLLLGSCDDTLFGVVTSDLYFDCEDRNPPLTYDRFGKGFLQKQCTGCHSSNHVGELRASAPVGVDFDSYALTLEWADRIQARAVDTEGMPPSGGPSPEEREVFAEWMACEVLPARRELESAGQICETPPCDGQIGDTDDGSEEARWHTGWHR